MRVCEPSEALPEPKMANKTLMGIFGPGAGICGHEQMWLARDGKRRCLVCEPPALPAEVVA